MMRIKNERKRFDSSSARLRYMRRRYARLIYPAFCSIPDDKMEQWINSVAAGCIRRGLWTMGMQTKRQKKEGIIPKGTMSQARYALLRSWWRIEGGRNDNMSGDKGPNWHCWYTNKGFCAYTFEYVGKRTMRVVA